MLAQQRFPHFLFGEDYQVQQGHQPNKNIIKFQNKGISHFWNAKFLMVKTGFQRMKPTKRPPFYEKTY